MGQKIASFAGVTALVAVTAIVSAQQRETRERGVLVSVATSSDAPVTDMKATDFTVRENGVAREVLRVAPAPPPSHVVLLLDDSHALQGNVPFLRPAATTFVGMMAALSPAPQLALYTFGERPTRRVEFTPNPEPILDAVKRIFPITNSGAYFLQAITDVTRDLRKREAASPVIVAFVSEAGPEFSSELHQQVADALRGAGASLWAITLQQGGLSPTAPAIRERSALLGDVVANSGGFNKVVLSGQGIESAFRTVTTLLTSRYLVTYGRPESLIPPDRIEVTSNRRDVRVRASRWAGK
jgi:hypothetical protein